LKGWGIKLRVLGFNPQIKAGDYNPAIPNKIRGLEIYD